jgi:hypothetical protein
MPRMSEPVTSFPSSPTGFAEAACHGVGLPGIVSHDRLEICHRAPVCNRRARPCVGPHAHHSLFTNRYRCGAGGRGAAALRPYGFVQLTTRAGLGPAPTSTNNIRHSRFAVFSCCSPLAARRLSPFTIRDSLFAIRHSLLAVLCPAALPARLASVDPVPFSAKSRLQSGAKLG